MEKKERGGCGDGDCRRRRWKSDGGHVMGFKLAACPLSPSPCDRCRRLPLNVARSTGARVPIPKGEARRWRSGKEAAEDRGGGGREAMKMKGERRG